MMITTHTNTQSNTKDMGNPAMEQDGYRIWIGWSDGCIFGYHSYCEGVFYGNLSLSYLFYLFAPVF